MSVGCIEVTWDNVYNKRLDYRGRVVRSSTIVVVCTLSNCNRYGSGETTTTTTIRGIIIFHFHSSISERVTWWYDHHPHITSLLKLLLPLTTSSLVRAREKFQEARLLNSSILASMHQLFIIVLIAQLFCVCINYFLISLTVLGRKLL